MKNTAILFDSSEILIVNVTTSWAYWKAHIPVSGEGGVVPVTRSV